MHFLLGETDEVIRAAAIAKEKGCKTIGITKYGDSTLSRSVDIPLYTSSTENEIRSGAMSSRITRQSYRYFISWRRQPELREFSEIPG